MGLWVLVLSLKVNHEPIIMVWFYLYLLYLQFLMWHDPEDFYSTNSHRRNLVIAGKHFPCYDNDGFFKHLDAWCLAKLKSSISGNLNVHLRHLRVDFLLFYWVILFSVSRKMLQCIDKLCFASESLSLFKWWYWSSSLCTKFFPRLCISEGERDSWLPSARGSECRRPEQRACVSSCPHGSSLYEAEPVRRRCRTFAVATFSNDAVLTSCGWTARNRSVSQVSRRSYLSAACYVFSLATLH